MRITCFIAILGLMFAACGGESTSADTQSSTKTEAKEEKKAAPAPAAAPAVNNKSREAKDGDKFDVELAIAGNDLMQYDKKQMKVKAGQVVKLTLTHSGKLPKESMGHNFVLLQQSAIASVFATKAVKARANDYIPEDQMDDIVAYTKMIGGGESTSIIFTAPSEKGSYEYVCTFPGHYGQMIGALIVE